MTTQGPRTNFALLDRRGRKKYRSNYPPGQWFQTVQPWTLFELFNGTYQPALITAAVPTIKALFFAQDVPVLVWSHQVYVGDAYILDTNMDTWKLPRPDSTEVGAVTGDKTGFTYLVSTQATYGLDEAFVGTTLTNHVKVVGYLSPIDITNRGYVDGNGAPLAMVVTGCMVCQGQVIAGDPNFVGAGTNRSLLPILLNEAAYTEAIYERGNRIVGPATTDYYVAGLWQGLTRTP